MKDVEDSSVNRRPADGFGVQELGTAVRPGSNFRDANLH